MKLLKIAAAVLLMLLMLYVTRQNSRGRSEYFSLDHNGYTLEMHTVPKIQEYENDEIVVSLTKPPGAEGKLWFLSSEIKHYTSSLSTPYMEIPMTLVDSAVGRYAVSVTAGNRGGRIYYYFEFIDRDGKTLATFKDPDGRPFMLKYIGRVPVVIIVFHIAFLFATVFCVSMAAINAFGVITTGKNVRAMVLYIFWATVFTFLGMVPFGWPMNYYAFDVVWEAVPFGTDATDNKTQLIFVYLLFVTLAGINSLTRGKKSRDLYAPRTLGWFGLGAFSLMLFIYMIPHSIQFTALLTYTVCYSFIALVLILYLYGYCRKTRFKYGNS
ncbi:MAG: hypothetical protein PHU88_12010 [candidate division Zixibacteria bacterium]|nr:hypothetical protein [candidate division Zixibacteria bacterium]